MLSRWSLVTALLALILVAGSATPSIALGAASAQPSGDDDERPMRPSQAELARAAAQKRGKSGNPDDPLYCGKSITHDLKLTADLGPCTGSTGGLAIVDQNGITIDLNGHTIFGTGGGMGIGIYNSKKITVRGPGLIHDFSDGVHVEGGSSNTVTGITVRDTTDDGIQFIFGATKNRASKNKVSNTRDTGFSIRDTSTHNELSKNQVSNAGNILIELHDKTDFNQVTDNVLSSGPADGLQLVFAQQNTISGNKISGVTDHGIHLQDGSHRNTIRKNSVTSSAFGIFSEGSVENSIKKNTATGNGTDLTDASGFCLNTWRGNKFGTANPSCIR